MKGRDRIVLLALVVLAVIASGWIIVVSPEREQASKLGAQVTAAKAQLAGAEGQLASARAAKSQYAAAYASFVTLGKAVPPTQEVPALIDQLTRASNEKDVQFSSITSSAASGSTSASPAAGSASAGFSALPFAFVFEGSFFDLEHLFQQLTDFTTRTGPGALQVSGRLLTIQSVKLSPAATLGNGKPSELTGSITASAYVMPASQGASTATGATPASGAAPAAGTTTASSPTAPAIVRVNP